MARSRRNQTSMKCAIGREGMLLFAGVTCIAQCVTKVIVGSCPPREMITVFVILSGCLPVLLSALRQPYNSGHEINKNKFSVRVSLVSALLGVIINLAWLVAGTYVVIKTWNSNSCARRQSVSSQNGTYREVFRLPTSSLFDKPYAMDTTSKVQASHKFKNIPDSNKFSAEILMDYGKRESAEDKESSEETLEQKGTSGQTKRMTEIQGEEEGDSGHTSQMTEALGEKEENSGQTNRMTETLGEQEVDSGQTNIMTETLWEQDVNSGHTDSTVKSLSELGDNNIITETLDQPEDNVTQTVTGCTAEPADKSCITCDIGILRFSLVIIIVDWLFVLFELFYFCYFVYYRFASLNGQMLLINT